MRALNPFTGEFYLETLQVSRYTREMYCLFGGRHTHPSTIMPGGCSADITHQTMHRLLRAPDAVHRLLQAHRADARRPLRLLLRGAAGLRAGRLPRHQPRLLGRLRRPRVRRLPLRLHDRVGPAPVRHPGARPRRRADHHRPGRDQPGDADPARQLVLRRLVRARRPSSPRTRSGTRSTSATRGTRSPCPKPQKRDFADKYSWVVSPRMYDARNDKYVRHRHRRRARSRASGSPRRPAWSSSGTT